MLQDNCCKQFTWEDYNSSTLYTGASEQEPPTTTFRGQKNTHTRGQYFSSICSVTPHGFADALSTIGWLFIYNKTVNFPTSGKNMLLTDFGVNLHYGQVTL